LIIILQSYLKINAEVSQPIANTLGENHRSTLVLESLLENQNPSIRKYVKKDLMQYTTHESIKRAPSSRYHSISNRLCNESSFIRYRGHDMYQSPIVPERTLVLNMKQRVQSGPLHPEFDVVKDRSRSFEENGINNGNTALQAEAGFYCTGKLISFKFYSGYNIVSFLLQICIFISRRYYKTTYRK
jgi:hypothetical protein